MSTLKVLQVMPDFGLAGAEVMCENLVAELIKKEQVEVRIISFYNKHTSITDRLEKKGVKIYYLDKKNGMDFSIVNRIKKVLLEFAPDVIHTHRYALQYLMPAVKLSKFKGKIVHTVHNVAEKEVPKRLQFFQKRWFKKGKVIPVAISDEVKKSIINFYQMDESKVPLAYNGIDLSKCIVKQNYEKTGIILHIGRFEEQKNHEFLIDIFSELLKSNKDLKLFLVGDGYLRPSIEEKVSKLGLSEKVIFKGQLSECYSIMNIVDMFILPSKWEGMPMTLIEAMGTGLPCLATPVGGIPDMITNETDGFLANDLDEFVRYAEKVENDCKLREKIGRAAIKKVKMFSSLEMVDRYYNIYVNEV